MPRVLLVVPVSLNLISLPPSLTVPLSQTTTLPVQLSAPAPAGGVTVAVVSSDPAVARPVADSVFIAAGAVAIAGVIALSRAESTTEVAGTQA